MAQHNLIITSIKIWRNNSSFYHGSWIIIIVQVMGTIWAKCDRICCRINASACSSCSLRIICRRWWHIPHEYMDKETIDYTEENIKKINEMAKVMTPEEIKAFIEDDYSYMFTSLF